MNNIFIQKSRIKKSGESLIEVLIAVVILMIFLVSILNMMNQSISLNENIRMRVMAINLAREGIEGVRSIRDTNWLRFSGNMRENWLCYATDADDCTNGTDNIIVAGEYIVDFKDGRFTLKKTKENQLYLDSNTQMFTHKADGNAPTPFKREIKLSLENIPCPENCPQKLKVVSMVSWDENDESKKVTLEAHLYDYFKRDEY